MNRFRNAICERCGEDYRDSQYPWENVYGPDCPQCGKCMGTIFQTGDKQYVIPPHGCMGNKSYREDVVIGYQCVHCRSKL